MIALCRLRDMSRGVIHEENVGKNVYNLYLNSRNKLQSRYVLLGCSKL